MNEESNSQPNDIPPNNVDFNNIDPSVELEVRIVALVLGEASVSEREELERLIEQRADLRAFRDEMEEVHGVLNDVGEGEWAASEGALADSARDAELDDSDWKLSGDHRTQVLAAITGSDSLPETLTANPRQLGSIRRPSWWNQNTLRGLAKIAAVLCLAGFFGQMLLKVPMQMAHEASVMPSSDEFLLVESAAEKSADLRFEPEFEPPSTNWFDDSLSLDDSASNGPVRAIPEATNGSDFGFEDQSSMLFDDSKRKGRESWEEKPGASASTNARGRSKEVFRNFGGNEPTAEVPESLDAFSYEGSRDFSRKKFGEEPAADESTTRRRRVRGVSPPIGGTVWLGGIAIDNNSDGVINENDTYQMEMDSGLLTDSYGRVGGGGMGMGMGLEIEGATERDKSWKEIGQERWRGGNGKMGGSMQGMQRAAEKASSGQTQEMVIVGDFAVAPARQGRVALGVMPREDVAKGKPKLADTSQADIAGQGQPFSWRGEDVRERSELQLPASGKLFGNAVDNENGVAVDGRRFWRLGSDESEAPASKAPESNQKRDELPALQFALPSPITESQSGKSSGSPGKDEQAKRRPFGIAGFEVDRDGEQGPPPLPMLETEDLGRQRFDASSGRITFGGAVNGGAGINGDISRGTDYDYDDDTRGLSRNGTQSPEMSEGSQTGFGGRSGEMLRERSERSLGEEEMPAPSSPPISRLFSDLPDKRRRSDSREGDVDKAEENEKRFFSAPINESVWVELSLSEKAGEGKKQEAFGKPSSNSTVLPQEQSVNSKRLSTGSVSALRDQMKRKEGRFLKDGLDPTLKNQLFRAEETEKRLNDDAGKPEEVRKSKRQASPPYYVVPSLDFKKTLRTKLPASKPPVGLDEKSAAREAFSTFSLHVGDVAFKLARSALAAGSWPDPAKVRIEEFVNALDYGDPLPSQSERVACRVEQAIHPFLQQRNLLRVSMRTAATGRASTTPLRLTFLLDNSGSMERMDRQQTVRRAFALLASQLQAMDQVTLISFARQPRLLADKVDGTKSAELVRMIDNLPSEGGTNLEAALQLAFEKALEQQTDGAQNRIILLTDGAVNLGDADPESLSTLIETMRSQGIAFDAAGIGADGLNDEVLEALARKGDGRYYLLDSAEAADDGFARQIAGALRPAAMNVKVQVEFNPERVGQYKLLGFEKHRLAKEDFRNDKVDAAELAAAEAGVAIYQFEAKPDGEGDVGSVSVRFRDMSTGQMVENRWPIPYESNASRLDESAPSMRTAATAALFAAKLRGDGIGQMVDLKSLAGFLANLPDQDQRSKRIGQLEQMIQQARQLQGE